MTAKIKKLLTAAFCIVWSAILVVVPLAWFAGYWSSGSSVDIRPGANPKDISAVMWLYYSENDGAEDEDAEMWKEYGTSYIDPVLYIPAALSSGTGSTFQYNFESLHFGKVDNLVTLRDDNTIYMRFAFQKTLHGSKFINISLSYSKSGYTYSKDAESVLDAFYIYKMDSESILDLKEPLRDSDNVVIEPYRYVIEHDVENPAAVQFIQFKYALSSTECSPGTDAFSTLEFSDSYAINCGYGSKNPNCTACQNGTCGYVHIDDMSNATNDVYYLYIEMTPILEVFGMQENILDYFVPSYMLFDVEFNVEVS